MRRSRPSVGEIELELGSYELRSRGLRVKLEKKPMELRILLVGRAGTTGIAQGDRCEIVALGSVILTGQVQP